MDTFNFKGEKFEKAILNTILSDRYKVRQILTFGNKSNYDFNSYKLHSNGKIWISIA